MLLENPDLVCAAAARHAFFKKGEWENQHLGSGEGKKAAVAHTGGPALLLLDKLFVEQPASISSIDLQKIRPGR